MTLLMADHRAGDLADELRHRVLALPGHRPVRRPGRRLVLGRHALRGALVPARTARASRWACTAPATRARRSTSSSRRRWWWPSAGPWCRRSTRPSCWARVVLFWFFSDSDPAHLVPSHTKFSDQLKMLKDPKVHQVLPVLQHRVRRLRGAVAVDGAVLRRRVRPGHPRRGAAGGLLLAARRRAARGGRLAVRQVRRAQRHLVGDVGELDLPVPAELPADRLHDPHRQRPEDLPHRPERLRLHRADVHPGHRLGLRQGQRLQVHQRRLPAPTSAPSAASSAWPAAWAASCCRSCSAR